jgi:hypothetical protein
MTWSEDEFRRRCQQRAAELGKPLRKLLDQVGLGHDTMDRQPGRRIVTLQKIAQALDWSLAEVMGFAEPGRVSPDLLEIAHNTAQDALRAHLPPGNPGNARRIIRATARVYNVLQAAQSDGAPIDEHILAAIRRTFGEIWAAEDEPPATAEKGEPAGEDAD